MSIRQQLVNCLEFAEGVEQIYDAIVQRQEHIAGMQSEENRREDRLSSFRRTFWCFIGFSALFVGAGIVLYGLNNTIRLIILVLTMVDTVSIIAWFVIAAIVFSAALWIRSAKKLRRLKAENQRKRQELAAEIQELQGRMRSKLEEGSDKGYYRIVPADYFSSDMLRYCISVIDRKLATTLQEVFLLLEQELQRQEQLEHSQMLYDAQAERLDRLTDAVNVNTMVTMLAQQERYR